MDNTDHIQYKPKKSKWKAHCAVDVGCLSSGYAYSFKDTEHVWADHNWADHLSKELCRKHGYSLQVLPGILKLYKAININTLIWHVRIKVLYFLLCVM